MADDLFAAAAPRAGGAPLTVFRAELLSHGPADWESLVEGFATLKAITFSSSLEFLTKRMVTCHVDAAIAENRSVTERLARRAHEEIGTALYRAYLQRLIPEVCAMRAEIDADTERFLEQQHLPRLSVPTKGWFHQVLHSVVVLEWTGPLS